MPPAVVPVEDGSDGAVEEAVHYSCHVSWLAWWNHVRCLLASTFLPCPPAPGAASAIVRGTLFLPSTGDRRVRLFLQEHGLPAAESEHLLVLDLPAGLGGADIAAAGRIVLEYQRQWAPNSGALLNSPKWLVYCNGRRVGFAARREKPSDAEGWVLEKLWAVTAGAGRLPGGGVEYLRGRFERIVGSSDAESFHLVEPIGWQGVNGGDGGLSIFFHRI
ncbi:protein MIZU-KUSSEI 1-like [Phragmites australis]|uniref:protein MIZU-KUSSEI 1-like n=1 Tax=Phragmites australis TaxID=29695 RepID=UPI002D771864|nr:protein MIZU-KUSSEI 1-like [Phragmites australis]